MLNVVLSEFTYPTFMAYFDTAAYLNAQFLSDWSNERVLFPLKMFHEVFSTLPGSLRILDYGTGPTIMTIISAATRASGIVLSDYSEENRESLRSWLRNDANAFNWSPLFDYVIQRLEGNDVEEARKREELVRKVVTDVIHCDIYKDPIIEKEFEKTYDVVSSSCCVNSSCSTLKVFRMNMQKLVKLVKPGGHLILFQSQGKEDEHGYFMTGGTRHPDVHVSAEYLGNLIQSFGYENVNVTSASDKDQTGCGDSSGFIFLTAVRKLS